jgi:Gly-Xaa carboxypeptidase
MMEKSVVEAPLIWRMPGAAFVRIRILMAILSSILLLNIYGINWLACPLPFTFNDRKSLQEDVCHQVEPLMPKHETGDLRNMDEFLRSDTFRNESIKRLSGAIKIPTISFDDLGPIGQDHRWDIFYEFHEYLQKTFPLIHSALTVDVVNFHGLLYTWEGSDPSLKPTLLMAHQDVVPVPEETIPAWTHPPFSGFYDGKFVWGRGASDCKNQLIAIMEAVELLLDSGFAPRRTIVMSFGFDEEASGPQGAQHLALHLLSKFGRHSFAAIVDEGSGVSSQWGSVFAAPGVAEKGYIDVDIVIRSQGGHSSIPPPHTSIGMASELVSLIESNPHSPSLSPQNPYLGLMECGAQHAPNFPKGLKKLLRKSTGAKARSKLAREASKQSLAIKYLMTTSQAVDIIRGGVKVNALPERTVVTVNYRVNVGESTAVVKKKLTKLAKQISKKHNLTLNAFDGSKEGPMSLSLVDTVSLEPAPVSPTATSKLSAYSVLSGSTRALYGPKMIVTPGIMTGNTDTKYYWQLSANIFRYAPGWDREEEGFGKIHTVDERASVKAHVLTAQWFSLFLRNMDEAALP